MLYTKKHIIFFLILFGIVFFLGREFIVYQDVREKFLQAQFLSDEQSFNALLQSEKEALKANAIGLSQDPAVLEGYRTHNRLLIEKRVTPLWQQLKQEGLVSEIHFFKKPAISFVNMSNIQSFNIDTSSIRTDMVWVTSSFQSSTHFHICRSFAGLRATYPLTIDGNVVGGVSVGKNFDYFIDMYKKAMHTEAVLLYDKYALKEHLIPSVFSDYVRAKPEWQNFILAKTTYQGLPSLTQFNTKAFFHDNYVVTIHDIINFDGQSIGKIVFYHPHTLFTEQFRSYFTKQIIIFFSTLIMAIIMLYLFTTPLLRAIASLTQLTHRLKNRDFSVLDEFSRMPSSPTKELERLKRHIIDMGVSLQNYIAHLDEKVAQKTQELALINYSLEQRVNEEMIKRHKQEQLMIERSKLAAMGSMMSAIAHQWRQPLSIISLQIHEILDAYRFKELTEEHLEHMTQKALITLNSLSKTIDGFRSFFKTDEEKKEFDALKHLHEAVMILEAEMRDNQIDINESHSIDKIIVFGYQHEFQHVCYQLIANAKDAILYAPSLFSRTITISTLCDSEFFTLFVEDEAGGVPSEIAHKIFEPYFTTKATNKGMGVGLYVSKIIIEDHFGGEISFHNTERGAVFSIKIPLK